jgi:hypothetical protein
MIMSIERGWPHDVEMPAIPWDDITKLPEIYFDTKLLPVGVPLAKPESLSRGQIYILVDHIHTCQSAVLENDTTPRFAFRSKVEIQERQKVSLAKDLDIDDQSSDAGDKANGDRGNEGDLEDDMGEILKTKYVTPSHLHRFNYLSMNRKGERRGNKNARKRKSTSASETAILPISTRKKKRMSAFVFISNCILSLPLPHRSSPAGPALRTRKRVDYTC